MLSTSDIMMIFSVFFFHIRSLPLLLPAVEDGIFNDSWRIRQSSVELLGDLLFKVCIFMEFFGKSAILISLILLEIQTKWLFLAASELSDLIYLLCFLSRLLELLGKLYSRVVVMMRVLVLKRMDVLLLRFWEGISAMKFLLHYIWFELMSALVYAR